MHLQFINSYDASESTLLSHTRRSQPLKNTLDCLWGILLFQENLQKIVPDWFLHY